MTEIKKINELKDKIEAGIFGLVVGDALGVPVEFNERKYLTKNPVVNMREYGTHRQPKGTWSDDSSLTFCLLESLSNTYNLQDIANQFVKWKNESYWTAHGSVFDIGLATRTAINEIATGTIPQYCGGMDEYSNGNGSLMRILPMAFYLYNEQDIFIRYQKVKNVSSITHAHIRSVIACFIYVEYLIYLLQGYDKFEALGLMQKSVLHFLKKEEINPEEISLFSRILHGDISKDSAETINGDGYVLFSLEASFWAFLSTDKYAKAVLNVINLGKDTDTNGAITGGLAGVYYGFDNELDFWKVQLARFEDIELLIKRFVKKLAEK